MINKQKLITIGGSGLIGSRVSEILSNSFDFRDYSRKEGVDITDSASLRLIEDDTESPAVILLAAKTDVDGCEKDKEQGENGDAWKINVQGPRNVAQACLKNNKKLIYVSTDFVFNGEDTPVGGYTEENTPDPLNWYARTKHEGEKAVISSGVRYIVARTSYPYRKEFAQKTDFVRAIGNRLKTGQVVTAVSDHIMSPTHIDDFSNALGILLRNDAEGIFHVSGGSSLSPFEAAILIAKQINADLHLVKKTTRSEFFKDRAQRPFNLSIKNAKISELGASMRSFEEGVKEVFN